MIDYKIQFYGYVHQEEEEYQRRKKERRLT